MPALAPKLQLSNASPGVPTVAPPVAPSAAEQVATPQADPKLALSTDASELIRSQQALGNELPLLEPIPAGKVPVVNPSGEVGYIEKDELTDQLRADGWRTASQTELRKQQATELYGNIGGQVMSFAGNAVDMAAYGFGKGILHAGAEILGGKQTADDMLSELQAAEEENPISAVLGQGAGVIIPAMRTGGGSVVGHLAMAGAEKLGWTAAKKVGSEIVKKSVLRSAATAAEKGAAEMAIFGVGQTFSEAVVGDTDITAELLTAGALKAGLFGGAVGGTLGFAGAAAGKIIGKVATKETASVLAEFALHGTPEQQVQMAELSKFDIGYQLKKLSAIAAPARQGSIDVLAEKVAAGADYAKELAALTTNATSEEAKILQNIGEAQHRLGLWLIENPEAAKVLGSGQKVGSIAKALNGIRLSLGEKILKNVDEIAEIERKSGETIKVADILEKIRLDVVSPIEKIPGYGELAGKLDTYSFDFAKKSGAMRADARGVLILDRTKTISFKKLHEFRAGLDDLVNANKKVTTENVGLKEFRKIADLQREVLKKMAADKFGIEGQKYLSLAHDYHMVEGAADIAKASTGKAAAAGPVGLGQLLLTLGGLHYFGLTGLIMSFAGREIFARAPQFMAANIAKVAKLSALKGSAAETSSLLAKTAKSAVNGTIKAAQVIALDQTSNTKKNIKRVQELATSPERTAKLLEEHVDPNIAPQLSQAYVRNNIQILQHLAASAPKGSPRLPLLPNGPRLEPSKEQLAEWSKKLDIYRHPYQTINAKLRTGRLTATHMQAFQQYYPQSVKQLRNQVLLALAEYSKSGKIPSYATRMQLSLLMQAPVDNSVSPDFIQSQQAITEMDIPSEQNTVKHEIKSKTKANRASFAGGEDTLDEKET